MVWWVGMVGWVGKVDRWGGAGKVDGWAGGTGKRGEVVG